MSRHAVPLIRGLSAKMDRLQTGMQRKVRARVFASDTPKCLRDANAVSSRRACGLASATHGSPHFTLFAFEGTVLRNACEISSASGEPYRHARLQAQSAVTCVSDGPADPHQMMDSAGLSGCARSSKGSAPASSWYAITPAAQTSLAGTTSQLSTSGAMYLHPEPHLVGRGQGLGWARVRGQDRLRGTLQLGFESGLGLGDMMELRLTAGKVRP